MNLSEKQFVNVGAKRGIYEITALLEVIRGKGFVCGGYARYCLSPLPTNRVVYPGDLDIYCYTEEHFNTLKSELRKVGFSQSDGRRETQFAVLYSYFNSGEFAETKTYVGSDGREHPFSYYGPDVQLIKPALEGRVVTVGDPETILENFDFTVARAAIITPSWTIADKDFEADEMEQFLRIKNIHCPISSSLRFHKYAKKGYSSAAFEVYKLFEDWDTRGDEWKAQVKKEIEDIKDLYRKYEEMKASGLADRGMQITAKNLDEMKKQIGTALQAFYERRSID